jgi:lipoprotein-anchoring transpeptidase ErfK/SrfK
MDTLFRSELHNLSRRDFLKLTGTAILGLSWLPFRNEIAQAANPDTVEMPSLGRILVDRALVYDKPSLSAKVLKAFQRDLVLPITAVTMGDGEPSYNRLWYKMNNEGFVHSGSVQPVEIKQNVPLHTIPSTGLLAEVTVPFTDTLWNLRLSYSHAYRLYYSTVHWITAIDIDEKGKNWYRIFDDKWDLYFRGEPAHFRPITVDEVKPLSPEIPLTAKRIEVHLEKQVVIAYEYNVPVFMTRTATGAHFSDGDYTTPVGKYMTNRKRPSRHMAAGDRAAPNSYDLPGIPWVGYLTKSGISFHGTYWHNDYGKPRSHGCINLSPAAAKWIYRWTLPVVPFDQTFYDDDTGTSVQVMQ